MANDAITNIKKYSVLTIHFLKEQYFKVVPFGKELHEVLMEIYEEIKTLKARNFINMILISYRLNSIDFVIFRN